MTNTIKQTLIERRDQINVDLEALLTTQKNMMVQRAKQLLDIPDHVEVKVAYGDSIYLYLENKEIFSIHNRTYGKPYLNTYSTMMEDVFEFERLMINGKIAEKFLYDKNMFEKLFAKVDNELVNKITATENEIFQFDKEIRRIENEEAQSKKDEAMKNFLEGNEIKFENIKMIQYGRGRYDNMNRVLSIKKVDTNKSNTKFTIEFNCQKYDSDETVTCVRDSIMLKYIQDYIR